MACRKRPKICTTENGPLRRSSRLLAKCGTLVPSKSKLNTTESGPFKTPAAVKIKSRRSVEHGWKRAFRKYSPSKELTLSPIKASEANLSSVLLTDHYVDMYTWVTNMSEQHVYENAFLLLSYNKNNEKKMATILRRGFSGVDLAFFNGLRDVILLGKGSYGGVYCCRDPKTNIRFAMKHIFGEIKSYFEGVKKILTYLAERNASIRAMDCPFVVKFYYSLLLKSSSDLFLFYQFCIGDLHKYFKIISDNNEEAISKMIHAHHSDIVHTIYKQNTDLLEANLVYIFEIFCGLDFLVKCNIIHQDIKPANLLIADNLHIKIGDFGITYRTRSIHRRSNRVLVHHNMIEQSEAQNFENALEGTPEYHDVELQMFYLSVFEPGKYASILSDKEKFDVDDIVYTKESVTPCFLVDTWSAGAVAVMLLFRGFSLFNPLNMHEDLYSDVPIRSTSLFIINFIGRQSIYTHYVHNGLIKGAGTCHRELMTFLVSIFKPRATRCLSYTKEKEVYHFTKRRTMRYIDLDKVETFKSFSDRHFNRSNIHLREVSEAVRSVFSKQRKIRHATLEELFERIKGEKAKQDLPQEAFVLDPGMMINFFN